MDRDEVNRWVISIGVAAVLAIAFSLFVFLLMEFPWLLVLMTVAYMIFAFAIIVHDNIL